MTSSLTVMNEPQMEFRYGQKMTDPRFGLSLFGAFDSDDDSHPKNLAIGLIGTAKGIGQYIDWSDRVMRGATPIIESNHRLWPLFPGFEAAFQCVLPQKYSGVHELDDKELIESSMNNDGFARTNDVVNNYLKGIEKFKSRDDPYDVIVCIVPEEIYKNCRKKSKIPQGWGKSPSKRTREMYAKGQTTLIENGIEPKAYRYSRDFRRQIKARCMKQDIPIQIVRESTLDMENRGSFQRGLTPLSDRAWNLATAIFYKAGGKPWKLSTAREGVSYIGISFKRMDPSEKSRTACCVAQMFLDSGDGIVFLGDEGSWYSPEDKQYHLSKSAASNLLAGTLKTYKKLEGKELTEIFLHSYSEINAEEFEGYKEACPTGVKLVGVRVRDDDDIKLLRNGNYPVARGTLWKWSNKMCYLWTTGFKWGIRTYDGSQVPRPLKIDIMHGDANINQVALDIFGLTKLNYNACRIGDSKPVTIKYSSAVGEILITNPSVKHRSPKFRFYI